MIVVKPLKLTPDNTQTNAPMDDLPTFEADMQVERGDRYIYEGNVYEATRSGNDLDLPADTSKEIPDWILYGAVNPYRLIDEFIETQTVADGRYLIINVEPNTLFDTISILNVNASTAKVEILDEEGGVEEVWWDEEILMIDADVYDWWEYFFTEPVAMRDYVFTGFPSTAISRIRITLDGGEGGGIPAIGKLIVGQYKDLGCLRWGAEFSLVNYSRVSRNEFGHVFIVPRSSTKEASFDLRIDTSRITEVFRVLDEIKDEVCLWIGEQEHEITIVLGIYKDYRTILRNRRFSAGVLYIEGVV